MKSGLQWLQVFGTAAFSPAEKNSNLLSFLDLRREWLYIKLLWSGKILLAAVSHRFQNDSQGLKSCMHVRSERKAEETQKRRRSEWFGTLDGSTFANKKDKWKIERVLISEVEIKCNSNVTADSTTASLEISPKLYPFLLANSFDISFLIKIGKSY